MWSSFTHLLGVEKGEFMGVTKLGNRVKIHYTGRLEDGTIFDSSRDRDPLEFTAGGSEVIPGVAQAVVGMQPGESKTVEVSAEDGFEPRKPGLEQRVPRSILPEEAQVGERLQAKVGKKAIMVWVTEIGEEFAVLAKEFSEGPSSANGGDLGNFRRGQMVKPFEEAVFTLRPGEVSDIVETEFGYHLIKVIDKKPETTIAYEDIKDRLEQHLKQEKVQREVSLYVEKLKEKAKVERFLTED